MTNGGDRRRAKKGAGAAKAGTACRAPTDVAQIVVAADTKRDLFGGAEGFGVGVGRIGAALQEGFDAGHGFFGGGVACGYQWGGSTNSSQRM